MRESGFNKKYAIKQWNMHKHLFKIHTYIFKLINKFSYSFTQAVLHCIISGSYISEERTLTISFFFSLFSILLFPLFFHSIFLIHRSIFLISLTIDLCFFSVLESINLRWPIFQTSHTLSLWTFGTAKWTLSIKTHFH